MKFLRWLALGLLNLLLFLSISLLGLSYMLNETVLNPAFAAAEVSKLDLTAVLSSYIETPQLPPDVQAYITQDMFDAAVKTAMKNSEPALKEELRTGVYRSYDYLLGKSNTLNIAVSLDPFKQSFRDALWTSFKQNPPSQINGVPFSSIPPATVQQYFDEQFNQFVAQIPSSLEMVNDRQLDAQTVAVIRDFQHYVTYYEIGWRLLIPLIFIFIAAIIFIENDLRNSLRNLGINLLVYGVFGFVSDILINRFVYPSFAIPGIPDALNVWVLQLVDDLAWPLTVFSIVVAVSGAALVVASLFVKKTEVLPQLSTSP